MVERDKFSSVVASGMGAEESGRRLLAIKLAWKMWGLPYLWGGDDPMEGFDCSGMVVEILKSVGVLPRKGDWTAFGLYSLFVNKEVDSVSPGCLVFWSNNSYIVHVEFALTDELCIGASSGGRRTLTWRDAVRQNAYIKIRPWNTRNGDRAFVDPFKGL